MNLSKEKLMHILNTYEKELKTNNFEELYQKLDKDKNIYGKDIGSLTEILLSKGINPALYMDEIPEFFLCESNIKNYDIPNNINKIGEGTFQFCALLTSVTMSNSVTEISERAFSDCYSLLSIDIPNSVKEIGGNAFGHCKNLTINYQGTISEWSKIKIGFKAVDDVLHIKCIDGDIK